MRQRTWEEVEKQSLWEARENPENMGEEELSRTLLSCSAIHSFIPLEDRPYLESWSVGQSTIGFLHDFSFRVPGAAHWDLLLNPLPCDRGRPQQAAEC